MGNFCYDDAFADAPANGKFLLLTYQTLPILNGRNCSVDDLLLRPHALKFDIANWVDLVKMKNLLTYCLIDCMQLVEFKNSRSFEKELPIRLAVCSHCILSICDIYLVNSRKALKAGFGF